MKMRRWISTILALLLSGTLPLTAFAEEYDLSKGSISVTANTDGQYVSQVDNDIKYHLETTPTVITQTITESEPSTANTITITAEENTTANVTLNGVNISADEAAIQTLGTGKVSIELDGTNTLQSGEDHAGVEKDNDGYLTIQDESGTQGSLTATGGEGGSGIGGGVSGDGSDIIISGGTVEAVGGAGGSGIGGGDGGKGSNITIYNSSVTAQGGANAAGIGGGAGGNGEEIYITSGTVEATGGAGGAGIGGGAGGAGDGIHIIKYGSVKAQGGENAAGIGGGADGDGSYLVIENNSKVEATGGNAPKIEHGDALEYGEGGGAGIGGGANGTGSSIFVQDRAVVTATGKGNAADIGNGNSLNATRKQENNVNVNSLTPNGSVNGKPGSYVFHYQIEIAEDSVNIGGGHVNQNGSIHDISLDFAKEESSNGDIVYKTIVNLNPQRKEEYLYVKIGGEASDPAPSATIRKDSLVVTADSDYLSLNGNRDAVISLLEQGVTQTVLQTSDGKCAISNKLLEKTTGTGGSFQVTADGGDINITTTDGNEAWNAEAKLKYAKDFAFSIDSAYMDSLGSTLNFATNVENASLTLTGTSLQVMDNLDYNSTAISTGNKIVGFNNKEVLKEIGPDQLEGASVILKTQKNATQKQEATLKIKKNGIEQQISQSSLVNMSIT